MRCMRMLHGVDAVAAQMHTPCSPVTNACVTRSNTVDAVCCRYFDLNGMSVAGAGQLTGPVGEIIQGA